jgi:hypothetical protein
MHTYIHTNTHSRIICIYMHIFIDTFNMVYIGIASIEQLNIIEISSFGLEDLCSQLNICIHP